MPAKMTQWPEAYRPPENATGAVWGRCGAEGCRYLWPVAFLPLPVDVFAEIGKNARCPACGGSKVLVGEPG